MRSYLAHTWLPWFYLWCIEKFFRLLLQFAWKTFGYLCASHEKGLAVMDQMCTAVRQCYGWNMPYSVSINWEQDFDINGDIHNLQLAQRLEMLARDLVIYGKLIREQFNRDLMSSDSNTFAAHYRVYPQIWDFIFKSQLSDFSNIYVLTMT